MKNPQRVMILACISLTIISVSLSIFTKLEAQGVTVTPVPTNSTSTAPLPILEDKVGYIPKDCPLGPEAIDLSPRFAPGSGGYPVWAVTINRAIYLGDSEGAKPWPPYGFPVKILWVVKSSFNGKVQLHGQNLTTGEPLWFSFAGEDATTTPELGATAASATIWTEYPSYLYIPKAGCYQLDAEWNGGMWRFTFPAGLKRYETATP